MPASDKSEDTTVKTIGSSDRPDDRYDPQRVEAKWFARWESNRQIYAAEATLPARCTWDTCATMPSATPWPVICG